MSALAAVEKKVPMNDMKTFRGRSLEDVLPQIKADLGPDAEIVRQREGLTGGVGGFFQRACIEVDARPGDGGEEPREARGRGGGGGRRGGRGSGRPASAPTTTRPPSLHSSPTRCPTLPRPKASPRP